MNGSGRELSGFGAILQRLIDERGLSRHQFSQRAGVDSSYSTRLIHSERDPPRRGVLEAFARTLRLSGIEESQLFVAAGYAPPAIMPPRSWCPTLQAVADVLSDPALPPEDRAEFAHLVQTLARRYRPGSRRNGSVP